MGVGGVVVFFLKKNSLYYFAPVILGSKILIRLAIINKIIDY